MLRVVMASRSVVGLAFGAFVVLAIPKSAFSVAWPTVAADLGRAVAELGVIIVVFTAGYTLASALSGSVAERLGTGAALTGASAASVAGIAGYAVTPGWVALLAAAAVLGLAGGIIDSIVNAHIAVHHGPRAMNLLHASFGVGATLGPLLIAPFLAFDGGWRLAYALIAVLQVVVTAAFWRTRSQWDAPAAEAGAPAYPRRPDRLLLWGGLGVFFLYAGVEVGAGAWAASLFVERGIGDATAGLAVAGYWGSFTLGRFAAGALGDRFRPPAAVVAGGAGAAAGLALLWWSPAAWVGPAALVGLGVSLAPIFPALVLLTPLRLGAGLARRAVGYQLAAASLGIAAIPGAAGLLVAWLGLEAVAPFLMAAALAMVGLNAVVSRRSQSPRHRDAPARRRRLPAGR